MPPPPLSNEKQGAISTPSNSSIGGSKHQTIDELMTDFNAHYMVVNESGKFSIYQECFDNDLKRTYYNKSQIKDFNAFYMNRLVCVKVSPKGEEVLEPAARVWLNHSCRRQYLNGIVFKPGGTDMPGVLNLWRGFAFEPKAGDWSLLKAHIRDIICSCNEKHFNYLMDWTAHMFQCPALMAQVAVLLQGVEGCGKGTFAEAIRTIMGQHAIYISNPAHLTGHFNEHLRDTVFVFADEANYANGRQQAGLLNALITSKVLTIEGKFTNIVMAPSCLHVMMASNEEWVIPASLEARRFFVLQVLASKVKDYAYFEAIADQLENRGGYSAMLHEMLTRDLTNFNVRDVPNTEGLRSQRRLSLSSMDAWWLDCLERGYVYKSAHGVEYFSEWHIKITMELLYSSYEQFATKRRERQSADRERLGKYLTELGAIPERYRNGVVGEAMQQVLTEDGAYSRLKWAPTKGVRPTAYVVGDLQTARHTFTQKKNISVNWDGGASEDDGPSDSIDLPKQAGKAE
jgi:hypothetical protein